MARGKVKIGEQETEVIQFEVGADYFEALGLQIRQGRFFDTYRPIEDAQAVVINQIMADRQEWATPIGKTFRQDGQEFYSSRSSRKF